jgi:hypothetical protein
MFRRRRPERTWPNGGSAVRSRSTGGGTRARGSALGRCRFGVFVLYGTEPLEWERSISVLGAVPGEPQHHQHGTTENQEYGHESADQDPRRHGRIVPAAGAGDLEGTTVNLGRRTAATDGHFVRPDPPTSRGPAAWRVLEWRTSEHGGLVPHPGGAFESLLRSRGQRRYHVQLRLLRTSRGTCPHRSPQFGRRSVLRRLRPLLDGTTATRTAPAPLVSASGSVPTVVGDVCRQGHGPSRSWRS